MSYGYLSPEVNLPNIKWLEGHKPLFNVTLEAVSTVHTQVLNLKIFYSLLDFIMYFLMNKILLGSSYRCISSRLPVISFFK